MSVTIPEKLHSKKLHLELEAFRSKGNDITLSQHLKDNYDGMTVTKLYEELGVDPTNVTIGGLVDKQDDAVRWLVPEIFRDAIRKGVINNPIYTDFIIREESVSQPKQTMPFWDLTGLNNAPKDISPAESVELGTLKYGSKTVSINKQGIGLLIDDEAIRFTNVSLMSIFLQDVGVKLGSRLGNSMISTLINGDQASGAEAAPVVGVTTANSMDYADFIRVFVRGSLRARKWLRVIGNEDTVNFMLNMDEFRKTNKLGNPELGLNVKTPVPRDIDAYVHNAVPAGQLIMVDPSVTMVQLTAIPLNVESERMVQRQVNGTYVHLMTGFAIIQRDGRIILDRTQAISAAPFPAWLAPLY